MEYWNGLTLVDWMDLVNKNSIEFIVGIAATPVLGMWLRKTDHPNLPWLARSEGDYMFTASIATVAIDSIMVGYNHFASSYLPAAWEFYGDIGCFLGCYLGMKIGKGIYDYAKNLFAKPSLQ
jgi:hypothetical protein